VNESVFGLTENIMMDGGEMMAKALELRTILPLAHAQNWLVTALFLRGYGV
jgi:hypothetical protein